jgi:hypothetical protein
MRKKLGRIVAWAFAAAILVYLFRGIHLAEIADAVRRAHWWAIPVNAIIVVAIYLADSFAIKKTFGWFVAPLSYIEVLAVRGATYLLALVSYSVGQGAIVYFVNRTRGIPILRGTAAVLLIMGINVLVLLMLASVGLVVAPDIPSKLKLIVAIAYVGLAIYITLVSIKPAWLAKRPVFDVLLSAGVGGHLRALLVRLPHIVTLLLLSWFSMAAFGIVIPVGKAILCLPIVYFVTVLPISPQGLGTSEFMLILFFAVYAPGTTDESHKAAILAANGVCRVVANVIQALIGLICMRSQLTRDLRKAGDDPTAASGAAS